MDVRQDTTVTFSMSDQDARDLWMTLDEALWATAQPLAQDGMPFNWRGNPHLLETLRDQLSRLYAPAPTAMSAMVAPLPPATVPVPPTY